MDNSNDWHMPEFACWQHANLASLAKDLLLRVWALEKRIEELEQQLQEAA